MSVTVYVPNDSTALAVGADTTARAISDVASKRGLEVTVIRNGSRGMFWLEPFVEVVTPAGRIAYGPVQAGDVSSLFDAGFLNGADHPLRHGEAGSIPYFGRQERLTFSRVGVTDPLSLSDYETHGGWRGLNCRNPLTN